MAKFINKKEQVYDLKLTSYGHHLLSIGEFKPIYYAFFDDNVIYDKSYTVPPTRDTYTLATQWQDNCSVYDASNRLQGWWRLNTDVSTTGDIIDSSKNGRNGTFTHDTWRPAFSTTLYPDLIQAASCTFDGTITGTIIGSPGLWDAVIGTAAGGTSLMSFSIWVYYTGPGDSTKPRLFQFGDKNNNNGQVWAYVGNAGKVWLGVGHSDTNGQWKTTNNEIDVATPTWTHVVITYDARAVANVPTIYIDGSAVAVTTATTPVGDYQGIQTTDAYIGRRGGATQRAFEGNLADFGVWNRLLSATEASLIYNASQGAATACPAWVENQNDIDNRIKHETQYLESLVLFEDIDDAAAANIGETIDPLSTELTWVQRLPRKDVFKMDAMIGDAYLDGKTNAAPAWKVVALQSTITSSQEKGMVEASSEIAIPQLNIEANYTKKVVESTFEFDPSSVRALNDQTSTFIDDKIIILEQDDPVFYIEEVNTELLTENFEIEVFGYVVSGSNVSGPATGSQQDTLERKYFRKEIPQIVDGFMVSNTKQTVAVEEITTGSVEYYFDVLADQNIEQQLACRGALDFDKSSYYIDLDFECDQEEEENVFYDIYGSVTEPEICQD
tara:strand:+ start:3036 stop:4871 length:1836 start_codon:yes stop_codon:yes gene_type:complete